MSELEALKEYKEAIDYFCLNCRQFCHLIDTVGFEPVEFWGSRSTVETHGKACNQCGAEDYYEKA